MDLTTEYLIIAEKTSSEAFYHLCDSSDLFEKLMQKDTNIVVGNGVIRYKGKLEFPNEIKAGHVEGKEQGFFQVKVIFKGDETELDEYSELLDG